MAAGVNVRVKLVDVIVMTVSKYSRSDRFKAILCCASLPLRKHAHVIYSNISRL